MSGECGHRRSPLPGGSASGNSEQLAKSASATLDKLNSMIRQTSDWREERMALESNVHRLKSALKKFGESPDEALRPDPLLVHQRLKINGLELTRDRLEDEVRGLRVELLEADQAITCSGAKILKRKMRKVREEAAEERGKLNDEIGHLRVRVREAEDDSSCSSLSRLRIKLREILNGDKKIERIIADVASRSCGTVIDLSNELTRTKELLDESRLENIRLNGESRRLKAALESAPSSAPVSGCSGYLETIERLGFHAKELERKIKEFEDDSGLVKRVGEAEEALNENRKELEEKEAVVTSLRNEILGAKTAYKMKSQELDGYRNLKRDLEASENAVKERDRLVADLRGKLKLSTSVAGEAERLREEMNRVKAELLNLEIERDGLLEEIEKMRGIVSDRNEQIVKILEENEGREKARRSEIEGVRDELRLASVENERVKVRWENPEDDSGKLKETSKASGDRDGPLVKKIRELEEELAGLKRVSSSPAERDSPDSDPEVKTLECRVGALDETKVRLGTDLSDSGGGMGREKLVARFVERLNKLKTENRTMRNEVENLEGKNHEVVDGSRRSESAANERRLTSEGNIGDKLKGQDTQTEDYFQDKVGRLEADNAALESELGKVIAERDALKYEFKKVSSANKGLSGDMEESKTECDKLKVTNEELKEKVKRYGDLKEKVETSEARLGKALEEADSLRATKASLDKLRIENEELKDIGARGNREREELVERVEKLRFKVEEQSKILRENDETMKFNGGTKTADELVMGRGDYVRADRELKYYIHLQSLAVKRVVDFIGYLDGRTGSKPSMATFLEPTMTNVMVLNFDENVTATFRMSQKLSEKIFAAEVNVQRLENLKDERNNLRAERDCLNEGVEKLSKMLSKLSQEISLPRDGGHVSSSEYHRAPFEYGTEFLAGDEVRERSATQEENHPYEKGREDEEGKFLFMNRRISALQRQIESKQREAAQRLIEMRETMRQERIRLMEIADRANGPP